MLFRGLPGLLDIKLDILQEVDTEVGVGADADGEVVGALLTGRRELQLHLLLGDQRGEMVGRSDERVGLPVRDVHPPGETILTLETGDWREGGRWRINLPELLFIISVVGTVDTV